MMQGVNQTYPVTSQLSQTFSSLKLLRRIPKDFPGGSDGKASAYNVGDPGSIPGQGRSPGEGSGKPLQFSCLENSMDGGGLNNKVLSTVPDTEEYSVYPGDTE